MKQEIKRREFLGLGLRGGSLIAAGGLLPAVSVAASERGKSLSNRPWWAREVDEPVLKIDDQNYHRFDQHQNVLNAYRKYVSEEQRLKVRERKEAFRKEIETGDVPGYRREDRALMAAGWTLRGTGSLNKGLRLWVRPSRRGRSRPIPEKWKTTPQHAAKAIKRAARFYGAADAGIALIDRRHLYSRSYGVDIVFEDVDQPYDVKGEKAVIPNKVKYAIAIVARMSPELAARAPSQLCDATTSLNYSRLEFTVGLLAEFIRNLGYIAIPSVNCLGPSIPFAVDAGLGEVGRTNRFISPVFGPAVQLGKVLTDMPMAPDKPIHFGLKEFCMVCGRCAETCPSKALSFDKEPDFKIKGEWNNPGHQTWFEDSVKCFEFWEESNSYCSTCIMVCPWAKQDKTEIHEIVKASSANFPFMDGFFTSMDKAFGYGQQKDPDKWWDLDLNEHGIDRM